MLKKETAYRTANVLNKYRIVKICYMCNQDKNFEGKIFGIYPPNKQESHSKISLETGLAKY